MHPPTSSWLRGIYTGTLVAIGSLAIGLGCLLWPEPGPPKAASVATPRPPAPEPTATWQAPAEQAIPPGPAGERVRYGRELVTRTAFYLGPRGRVATLTNGMNCQNCHLAAGTQFWGNNFAAVAPTYPKFRPRSGTVEDIYKRINDCVQRSLNGQPLARQSPEMEALAAYINWVGQAVPKGEKPPGSGIYQLPYLDRPADPGRGQVAYAQHCARCHQTNGQGQPTPDGHGYTYPPLWGPNSYNTAAGLYRLAHFAGYIKMNMPQGATWQSPLLTDEEAWDLAAYVNSRPRPQRHFAADWPDVAQKPVDHPFGPFTDGFSEAQHKYGPFGPIEAARQKP
ncbi:MAG: c-type cytochrome [Bernardetiaceae bacterium]|jgi:thiosulfate dehydrogenase|nr:c-type cytochrome [Bernardetiaceae bacterium]